MKTTIQKDKNGAVWLFIDRVKGRQTGVEELAGFARSEDEGNVAYAFLESELKLVRDAIDRYLKR